MRTTTWLALALMVACKQTPTDNEAEADTDTDTDSDTDTDTDSDTDTDTDSDTDTDPVPTDADGDGYPEDEDCDDNDADVFPGADELCDGVDNDCNDAIDDGLTTLTQFADLDEDGAGDPATETTSCALQDGYVENSDDCDDGNAAIHPSATETCDDIDNNCNGVIDDGLPLILQYMDADGDGWGDTAVSMEYCNLEIGYSELSGDCDDTEFDIAPDQPEICDGIDQNCDGVTDEGLLTTAYADFDGDGFGDDNNSQDVCSVPSDYVTTLGDCDDTDPDIAPDQLEFCDGVDNDCDGSVDVDPVSPGYLDNDGDGFGDFNQPVFACPGDMVGGVPVVADASDCDDANPDRYPAAPIQNYCDNIDDNCDGFLDETFVPTDYATIEDALQVAQVVCVEPGTYPPVDATGLADRELYSVDGPLNTVIDAAGAPKAIQGGTGTMHVEGFTITGANGEAGIVANRIEVANCIVENNTSTDNWGAGIHAERLWLDDSIVQDNTAVGTTGEIRGGGIFIGDQTDINNSLIRNNTVDCNGTATIGKGGGLAFDGITGGIADSTVSGNQVVDCDFQLGGGLELQGLAFQVERSLVADNALLDAQFSAYGAGIDTFDIQIVVSGAIVTGNELAPSQSAISQGAGLRVSTPSFTHTAWLEHMTVRGNLSSGGTREGAGAWLNSNTIMFDNSFSEHDHEAIWWQDGSLGLKYSHFHANGTVTNIVRPAGEPDPFADPSNFLIVGPPRFTDPTGSPSVTWDLTLGPTSPLRGAGRTGDDIGAYSDSPSW